MKLNFTKWFTESEQAVNSPELPDAKRVMYTACVLHKYSQSTLVTTMQKLMFEATGHGIPKEWMIRAHHMTVKFSPKQADIQAIASFLGKEIELQVVDWSYDEYGVAVVVKPQANFPMGNDVPHITVAHSKNVGAVYSNTLLANRQKWIAVASPINLNSELCCVLRDNVSTIPQLINPASTTL